MKTMLIKAMQFDTADEAVQHTHASGHGEAVTVDGKYYVAEQEECDRMAAAGVEFGYLYHHAKTGRLLVVPAY